jgi:putative oxidoreductase
MSLLSRTNRTSAPAATILIRFMAGAVFATEGIQKFLFEELGSGRFAKIGFASPSLLAGVVGGFELTCGVLLIFGLWTRLAALPLLTIIGVAIWKTKVPIYFESGFWKMAHESRTDFCMLLGAFFLLIVGAGPWSLDASRSNSVSLNAPRKRYD